MEVLKQQNLTISMPIFKNTDTYHFAISAYGRTAPLDNTELLKIQSLATLIQVLKFCVFTVQKQIWQLRQLNFQASILDIGKKKRESLAKEFESTKDILKEFAQNVKLNDVPILAGIKGQRAFLLNPDPFIKELNLLTANIIPDGNYDLILSVEKNAQTPTFVLSLSAKGRIVAKLDTGKNTLSPLSTQSLGGLEVIINKINTQQFLETTIGKINDAQLLSAKVVSPVYPGKYKILVQKSIDADYVYLGRFSGKLTGLRADVGGLELLFSQSVLHSKPNSKITEITIDYKSIKTPLLVATKTVPLSMDLKLAGKKFRIDFLPLIPKALLGNAFGAILSLAELNINEGFDPSINLEILETINLNLNNYDKDLTNKLTHLKRLFSKTAKGTLRLDPKLHLNDLEAYLQIAGPNAILKERY